MNSNPYFLLSVSAAADEFKRSASYIRNHMKKGLIRYANIQGTKGDRRIIRTYIYKKDMEDLIEKKFLYSGIWLPTMGIERRLNVSRSWVVRAANRGKIRSMKCGRNRVFLLEDCREIVG